MVVLTWATVLLCMGGAGVGGFLDLCEVFFYLSKMPRGLFTPRRSIFSLLMMSIQQFLYYAFFANEANRLVVSLLC